jgi:hypothetical protein
VKPVAIVMVLFVALAGATSWAMFAPIEQKFAKRIFEIPRGTWASRMGGEQVEILPDEIHLTLGVQDVLLLRNLDDVPQLFGPVLMMPGQSFQLPFTVASEHVFACTAHASGQLVVNVRPFPDTPLERLAWRLHYLTERG